MVISLRLPLECAQVSTRIPRIFHTTARVRHTALTS
nr:MAG TPA: hypothetical protein [Caudoviricetes sp.]